MANGNPNDPKGPGSGGNPLDPGTANIFSGMKDVLGMANEEAAGIEKELGEAVKHAEDLREETEHTATKLKDQFRLFDSYVTKYAALIKLAKKHSEFTDEQLKAQGKAREIVEEQIKAHQLALKGAKEGSAVYRQMADNLKRAQDILVKLPKGASASKEVIQEITDLLERASRDMEKLDKAFQSLGRGGATLKGFTGIMTALGMSGGRTIERKLEQIQDIKEKVAESREGRKRATFRHMTDKRSNALTEATEKGINVQSDEGRSWLAEKMGFKQGSNKYKAFMGGEKAIAEGGEGGAEYLQAMSEGGGAIEGTMTVLENGIEGLIGAMEGLAVPLMAVAGVIMLLIKVWDTYAKQNQEIEKSVGKGGLFTAPGQSVEDAFFRARMTLNPNLSARGVALGITQERNMALAGAMSDAGYNVADSFAPGARQNANQAPGAGGAFMSGSLGEFQRIVMGVSRVAGLTDAEGTQNLIKLLQEYRETMASSEDFMTQLNKDTQAAGISTTKYLKIIDEVSSHFDKMSKSLEEVTGVMRELSRYGAVSSESLKDMMDFLSQGQDKTTMGNIAQSIFTQMTMPKQIREAVTGGESANVQTAVDNVNKQLEREGIGKLDIRGMSDTDARATISQKRQEALGIKDRATRDTVTDSIDRLQDQMLHASTAKGGAFTRAAGGALYGEDLVQQTGKLFANLDEITSRAGASVQDLMEGTLSGVQEIQIQQEAEMLGIHDPKKAIKLLRAEAANRIHEATTPETPIESRRKFIKQLLTEIARKPNGLKMTLAGSQWEGFKGSIDDLASQMADNGADAEKALSKNAGTIGGSIETQAHIIDKMRLEQKTGVLAQRDALDTAADIGKRTQTVEDILKNVFKPLLVDLLTAVEFIAEGLSKWLGKDFDVNKKQTHADMQVIPTAIQDLQKKTAALMDEQTEMDKKRDKDGKLADANEQQKYDANKKAIDENTKTISYLGDVVTKGTEGTSKEAEVLHNTLKGLHAYVKEGGKEIAAPTMKDLEPSFWSKAWHMALSTSPVLALGANLASAAAGSMTTVNNYYGVDNNVTVAQPNSPGTSTDEHADQPQQGQPVGSPRKRM